MTVINKEYSLLRSTVWKYNRKKINKIFNQRLINQNVSIISMNCVGGVLYHDLGLKFCSPTVNLYFQAEDFICFCEDLGNYLNIDTMQECNDPTIVGDRSYPVAWLGDIKLFLVHYKSMEEAQEVWNRRKQRIQKNNIVLIATDRDGMTDELKDRFEKLPYHKVMFTHLPDDRHPSCFYLHGYENEDSVGIITAPYGWRGLRPVDQFDWVSFFDGAL